MRSFFDLAGFEYKKILKRKSTLISLILLFAVTAALVISTLLGYQYRHAESGSPPLEAVRLDRDTVRSKAGFIDEALINEAIAQNAVMIADADNENYQTDEYAKFPVNEAYIKYVLPYERVVNIINVIYAVNPEDLSTNGYHVFNVGGINAIDTMTFLNEKDFYEKINETITKRIKGLSALSENEKQTHLQMLSQVKTPFPYDFDTGYCNFNMLLQVIALSLLTFIAVCISPVFSNEYQLKTDQIMLASKYGKNKVIFAKLFTGASFSFLLTTAVLFLFLLSLLVINGFNGFDMVIQTADIYSTYPVTMIQATLTAITVTVFVATFYSMFVMLMSSLLKSPFLTVIVSFLVIFVPGLIEVSPRSRLLYQIIQLFPAKATHFSNIFSEYMFEIFGVVLVPAVFYIIFTSFVSFMIIPFAYKAFKHHQIG